MTGRLHLRAVRERGAEPVSEACAGRAATAGMHLTAVATSLCLVAEPSTAIEPRPSPAPSTCSAPFMDSWPFWRWPSRHILPVGITCRCYPTPRTRETIHSSYEPTPRTRSNLPCALPGSDSRFVSHRYAQAAATPMAAVGGAARPFDGQPAAQARQARPARLCGRSHALPAGSGRPGSDQGASLTSEAPWGGGFDMRTARVWDAVGVCRWSQVLRT